MLGEHKGLKVSAVLDGAGPELEELIRWSTHPDVDLRIGSAADFLKLLDDVEDELTDPGTHASPTRPQARRGDRLEGGFVVERVLGQGATGVALLVRRGDEEFVLKVARDARGQRPAPRGGRGAQEAPQRVHRRPARGRARSAAGRSWCSTSRATRRWPSGSARRAGSGLELLQRFGEDLLQAVASLERHGVAHRDIKPDNIGVRSGKQRLQLVLFDFSLARAPPSRSGSARTRYLDPFLSKRTAAAVGPGGRAVRGGGDALRDGRPACCPAGATASRTRR